MVSLRQRFSLMFSTIDVLCCSSGNRHTGSNVMSKNTGQLLVSKRINGCNDVDASSNASTSAATAASAFVGAEPNVDVFPKERLSDLDLKALLQQNLAQLPEVMVRLKHVEVRERTVRFVEKPDVRMVKAARGRLRSTQTEQRICLPTVDDIRAEKRATEISHQILKDAKSRLKHVKRRSNVGILTEKPDASMIQAAQRRLKPTQVRHKMYLPTADDIRAEKAAQAVPEKPAATEIQLAMKRLRHVDPVVRAWNPTAEELAANRLDRQENHAAQNTA